MRMSLRNVLLLILPTLFALSLGAVGFFFGGQIVELILWSVGLIGMLIFPSMVLVGLFGD